MWDYGNPPPPTVNLPPTDPQYGKDPHGMGSSEPGVIQLALGFLATGVIKVPCNGACVRRASRRLARAVNSDG